MDGGFAAWSPEPEPGTYRITLTTFTGAGGAGVHVLVLRGSISGEACRLVVFD